VVVHAVPMLTGFCPCPIFSFSVIFWIAPVGHTWPQSTHEYSQ
jgi:hypothetical protein